MMARVFIQNLCKHLIVTSNISLWEINFLEQIELFFVLKKKKDQKSKY